MKWKDLSLKERKQIYDSVRVNNPDATYFDIKEQFDSIPEYEDGKAGYTPEERAWVARRTVELGMEGKPAPQDSLYTIVDRAKVQNKPKKYDPTDSAIEQGKQVLSGLNKTVGTALTGASLATMGLFDAAGSRAYLLNPTEAKSHMLTLKRSLKDSGKITNWSTPVDEKMILEYMRNPTSNKMVKNQYDLYRNKNEYIDRLNKLIPMEILMPLGGAGFVGHELNKE